MANTPAAPTRMTSTATNDHSSFPNASMNRVVSLLGGCV